MFVAILFFEVLDEHGFRSVICGKATRQKVPILALIDIEQRRALEKSERAGHLCQPIGKLRAHMDFDTLYRVKNIGPEPPIESVQIPNIGKIGALDKGFIARLLIALKIYQ